MSNNQLTPEIIDLLNRNAPVMVKNFTKIVSWVSKGTASEHKMPEVVLKFLERFDKTCETVEQEQLKSAELTKNIEALTGLVETLTQQVNERETAIADLTKTVADLETIVGELQTSDTPTKPKRASKKAEAPAEAVATPAPVAAKPQDEVQVTAQAVDAGNVSPQGLAEIGQLIDGLLPQATQEQAAAPAAPVADMDEL